VRADLTIAVDIATRKICAAVLRPVRTKAVDAALLLARMLVPEPMRPGWSAALRMSKSRLSRSRLVDICSRMDLAAGRRTLRIAVGVGAVISRRCCERVFEVDENVVGDWALCNRFRPWCAAAHGC
jgi:hypothetical protein